MKKTICFILLALFSVIEISYAQNGRPQYQITAQSADTVIGIMDIELLPTIAPRHVEYFDSLVNIKFFDSTAFHRVVPGFVIQGGDPNSINGPRDTWGNGDPNQLTVPAEFTNFQQVRGTIGAARDEDINSASSQFYINLDDNSFLTSNYTGYGLVTNGMDVADSIVSVDRDENDNPLEKIIMFVSRTGINTTTIAAPTLTSPDVGTKGIIQSQRVEWEEVEGALLYHLQVSTDPDFNELFYHDSIASRQATVTNLEPGPITYYWRVRSNNGGFLSEFSETRSFETSIMPPTLLQPENNSDSISIQPTLVWNRIDGAEIYYLEINTRPTFSSSAVVLQADSLTDTTYTSTNLEGGTKYFWRVRGYTDLYEGPRSSVWNFTTEEVTSVEDSDLPTDYSLSQNYPNPFNPVTTIIYNIPVTVPSLREGPNVSLRVYDILGRQVATLVNKPLQAGRYQVRFDGSNLSSGIYYYKITVGDYSATKKMLLVK